MSVEKTLQSHRERFGLTEVVLRESVSGWQAIAKYRNAVVGPWGCGLDVDPIAALKKAFASGEHELTVLKRDGGVTHWSPAIEAPPTNDFFDDLL